MKWMITLITVMLSVMTLFAQEPLVREEQEFLFADQLEKRGMHDLAAAQFKAFTEMFPTSSRTPEALLRAGDNYVLTDSLAKASQAYMAIVFRYPASAVVGQACFNNAKLYKSNKEYLQAAVAYERLKLLAPQSEMIPDAQVNASACYYQEKNYQKALDAAFYVLENHRLHPLRLKARYAIAQAQQQIGEFQLALNELAKISGERIQDDLAVKVSILTADILEQMGRFAKADSVLTVMLGKTASTPSVIAAAEKLGQSLHNRGDYEKSDKAINSVMSKIQTQDRGPLYRILGDNAYALGDYQRAQNNYELIQLSNMDASEQAPIRFRQAMAQMQNAAFNAALQNFDAVVNDSSTSPAFQHKASLQAAEILSTTNKPLIAVRLLQHRLSTTVVAQFRNELLLEIANIQSNALHDFVAAKSSYQAILATNPDSPLIDDAQFGLAAALENEEKFDAACEEYERYLNYYPGGNLYTQAEHKVDMLTKFAPPSPQAAGTVLNSILMQNINGTPQPELLYELATQQADVFHDYEQALVLLARAQQADMNERLDVKQIISTKAECLYMLYVKAERDKNLQHKQIWQDSLKTILASAKNITDFQNLAQIQYLAVQTQIDDYQSAVDRAGFLLAQLDAVNDDSLQCELKYLAAISLAVSNSDSTATDAKTLLHQVIGATPNSVLKMNALYHQALLLQQAGLADSAKTLLLDLGTMPGPTKKAQAAFLLAGLVEEKGAHASAVILYDKVADEYFYTDYAKWAQLKAINLLLKLGRSKEAVQRINSMDALFLPADLSLFYNEMNDTESAWLWANISAKTQSPLKAIREFQHYLQSGENLTHRAEALFSIATLADKINKMDVALGHYQECAEAFPQDSLGLKALSRTAEIYFDRSMYEQARTAYKHIQSQLDGDLKRDAVLFEIICTYRLGEISQAQAAFKQYKKEYDDRNGEARLLYEEGDLQITRKNFNTAEKLLKQVADRYDDVPAGARGELGLARLYVITNKVEEALQRLTRIPENYTDPEVVGTAYLNLADFYYENRQLENCVLAAQQVLKHIPKGDTRAQAMNFLIHAYDDFQIKDKALRYTRQYIAEFPSRPDVMNHRIRIGIFLNDLKEYDRAIAYLTELKPQLDDDNEIEVQYLIAEAYDDAGITERAIIEYLKVRLVSKQNTKLPWGVTALYSAGLAYRKLGKYEKAIEMLELVIKEKGITDPFGREANSKIQDIKVEMSRENS